MIFIAIENTEAVGCQAYHLVYKIGQWFLKALSHLLLKETETPGVLLLLTSARTS